MTPKLVSGLATHWRTISVMSNSYQVPAPCSVFASFGGEMSSPSARAPGCAQVLSAVASTQVARFSSQTRTIMCAEAAMMLGLLWLETYTRRVARWTWASRGMALQSKRKRLAIQSPERTAREELRL